MLLIYVRQISQNPHENVINLLGMCTKAPNLCIVTPFLPLGALNSHLKEFIATGQVLVSLSYRLDKDLLRLAHSMAKGMQFLHQNKIVHRDLATRNCLCFKDASGQISIKVYC